MPKLRYEGPGDELYDPQSDQTFVRNGAGVEVSEKDAQRLQEYGLAHFAEVKGKEANAPEPLYEVASHPGTGQTIFRNRETGEVAHTAAVVPPSAPGQTSAQKKEGS